MFWTFSLRTRRKVFHGGWVTDTTVNIYSVLLWTKSWTELAKSTWNMFINLQSCVVVFSHMKFLIKKAYPQEVVRKKMPCIGVQKKDKAGYHLF